MTCLDLATKLHADERRIPVLAITAEAPDLKEVALCSFFGTAADRTEPVAARVTRKGGLVARVIQNGGIVF